MHRSDLAAPPIPATCAARPTTHDGLVIPFANVQLADGGCDFRSHHNTRWLDCWRDSRCQVCGRPINHLKLFLCGPRQLRHLVFDEPPVHPECARYVAVACPMVAGRRSRYRDGPTVADRARGGKCLDLRCDCDGWVPTPGLDVSPGGAEAHEWYAVFASDYHLAADPEMRITGGACKPEQVRRVRLVSEPGRSYQLWPDVPDWRARYVKPSQVEGEPQP